MMETHWIKIYSSEKAHEVQMLHGMLNANEVAAIIISKQDSSYRSIGEVELYVYRDDVIRANYIINKQTA